MILQYVNAYLLFDDEGATTVPARQVGLPIGAGKRKVNRLAIQEELYRLARERYRESLIRKLAREQQQLDLAKQVQAARHITNTARQQATWAIVLAEA